MTIVLSFEDESGTHEFNIECSTTESEFIAWPSSNLQICIGENVV